MPKLPQLNSRGVEKILEANGFFFVRQKGSHRILSKNDIHITVPHRTGPLKKGTLSEILKKAGIK